MKNFLKWAVFNLLIVILTLIRWLASESIEELQERLKRPQIAPKALKPRKRDVKPKIDKETGSMEWGREGVIESENRAMKSILKKNKLL